jgi:uncharacterized protein YdeI (BOF family)
VRVCSDRVVVFRDDSDIDVDIDVDKLLFSLLNISEQHSIIILDSSDLLDRSLIAVLAIDIQDFEKVN